MNFTLNEMLSVGTLIFLAGGFYYTTRNMNARFDDLQKKDTEHDHKLNTHENRLTRLETQIDHQKGWLKEMRDQLNAIYQKVMGS